MFRRFSANFAVVSIFFDFALIAAALYISSEVRILFNAFAMVKDIGSPVELPRELFIFFPMVWISVLLLFSIYDGRKNLRVIDEFGSLTLGTLLAAVALAGVLYLTYRDVSRFLFLFFVMLSFGFLIAWRLLARFSFRYNHNKGVQIRRVLILRGR